MDMNEFTRELDGLASSFGNSVKSDRAISYYEVFENVELRDWKAICQKAKMNADRFPTIKDLCATAYEIGAFSNKKSFLNWLPFECKCGHSFMFNLNHAKQHPESKIDCPGKNYEKCNISYDMGTY